MTLPDARHDPAAPTPEEREARIAGLRARRHARMRMLAIRSSLGAGLLVLALAVFGWWLLTTIGGRDLLLRQIVARLPENATLTWASAEGPASGPLTLRDVRFAWDGTEFTARTVTLDPALRPLLGRRLVFDALLVHDATLQLPVRDEPFELPRWPEVLPQVAPPLSLQADDIRIDGLRITRGRDPLLAIERVRGGLLVEPGALRIEHLVVESDRGRFAAHGRYAPADDYQTDLTATAVMPAPGRRAPLRLGLVARGDLSALDVGLAGAAPGRVRATLSLRTPPGEPDAPRWQLHADAARLDTALLAGADTPAEAPLSLQLRASGRGGRMRWQGEFERGGFAATLRPSEVTIEDQVLAFDPLVVRVLDGEIIVRGRGDLGGADDGTGAPPDARAVNYSIRARDLHWGTDGTPVTADANLGIAGTQAAWALAGRAELERAGETATLHVDGRGHHQQLQLRTLQVAMPTGTLDIGGELAWRPRLQWDLHARLAGFDPGYFAPGWDGAVRGTLTSAGHALDSGGFDAAVRLRDLGGRLRGRTLGGKAEFVARGEQVQGELALRLGAGSLDARGTFGTQPRLHWQADARLADFDPGVVFDGWHGAVDARISTRGRAREVAPGLPAPLDMSFHLRRLGGALRGRALSGDAAITIDGLGGDAPASYRGDIDVGVGDSRIAANGTIARTLDVDVRLQPLRLGDLRPDAGGVLRGTLRLTGARTAPNVVADLDGRDLEWGALRAASLSAQGRLPWQAGASPGGLVLRAGGLRAGVPLESLAVHARGAVEALSLEAEASGDAGGFALAGELRRRANAWTGTLASLRLDPARGAAWSLREPASFRWGGGRAALESMCLSPGGVGAVCASADWPRRGIAIEADQLPLDLLQPYLPERDDRAWQLRGTVTFDAQLRPVGDGWRGQASLTSASGGLRLGAGARRDLLAYDDLALSAAFTPARITAELSADLFEDGRLEAAVATGWDHDAPLAGTVRASTDELTWIELFSPDIVEPTGRLSADLVLGGTRAQPQLGGQARLDAFATDVPALGIRLSDGQARLDAQADGTARITGRVRSGDGVLRLDGQLGWQAGTSPLVLDVTGENVLAADTRELEAVIDPDVRVRVPADGPVVVSGTVRVPSARINLERLDRAAQVSPDVVVLDPVDAQATELATPAVLDLTLVLGENVALNGFGLTGGLDGRLHVTRRPDEDLKARGQLEIDGRYAAYGQRLEITRGRMSWSGGPVGDPLLDIRAEREVGGVTAGIDVRGRASAPRASVWSSEGGSQSEALAYLALGRSLSTVTGEEGRQLNAANAALSAGGSLLASQLGASIGLDDAGVIQSRALGGSVFGIGKQLSPKLYIGYGVSLLGTGQVLVLKYLLSRVFVLELESSSIENRASLNYRIEK